MRLDAYLVREGLIQSRERAKAVIEAGGVTINGEPARRASRKIAPGDQIVCSGDLHDYVSRGALKLVAALHGFGINPSGKVCLDLGASTGGFTEVLLRGGAEKVFAVDVGRDQLAALIKDDPRVYDISPVHVRDLTAEMIGAPIDLLVCDVSFISLMKALPPVFPFLAPGATAALLIKPQFELGPDAIGKGGIVTWSEEAVKSWIAEVVVPWCEAAHLTVHGIADSPIAGGDGNREYLLHGQWSDAP